MQTAVSTGFTLVGNTISNTGGPPVVSEITGSVGTPSSGGGITGFTPGTATGSVSAGAARRATAAYNDFLATYNAAMALTSTATPTSASMTASQTFLGNNVYVMNSSVSTTTLTQVTFNAQGNSNAVFVIEIPNNFTVNGNLRFVLENGAQAANIFWVVGQSATISVGGAASDGTYGHIDFDGNILAGTTFTMSAANGGSGGTSGGTINNTVLFSASGTIHFWPASTNVLGCAASPGKIRQRPAVRQSPARRACSVVLCSAWVFSSVGASFRIRKSAWCLAPATGPRFRSHPHLRLIHFLANVRKGAKQQTQRPPSRVQSLLAA